MCCLCNLLKNSFPGPKQLARTYFEVTGAGVASGHDLELEQRMDEAIEAQGYDQEQIVEYQNEFSFEYRRITSGE